MEALTPSGPQLPVPERGAGGGKDPHCGLGLHSTEPGGQCRAPRGITYLGRVGGLGSWRRAGWGALGFWGPCAPPHCVQDVRDPGG